MDDVRVKIMKHELGTQRVLHSEARKGYDVLGYLHYEGNMENKTMNQHPSIPQLPQSLRPLPFRLCSLSPTLTEVQFPVHHTV